MSKWMLAVGMLAILVLGGYVLIPRALSDAELRSSTALFLSVTERNEEWKKSSGKYVGSIAEGKKIGLGGANPEPMLNGKLTIYWTADAIPSDISTEVKSDEMPFLSENAYRTLGVIHTGKDKYLVIRDSKQIGLKERKL